jgi:hypothetical protein
MNCWHDEIDRSLTEDDVVRCAREYLALWAPSELAPLTLGWRELAIENASDVKRLKLWLTETSQLRELATYFWHAAARIEEIRRSRVRLLHFTPAARISAPLQ